MKNPCRGRDRGGQVTVEVEKGHGSPASLGPRVSRGLGDQCLYKPKRKPSAVADIFFENFSIGPGPGDCVAS